MKKKNDIMLLHFKKNEIIIWVGNSALKDEYSRVYALETVKSFSVLSQCSIIPRRPFPNWSWRRAP